ncbi:MAG: hypothetical protein LBF74_05125 [Treponema sp.]|jgi:hypothetical protein|nr:hypothetical protein [Treponema sp.]
MNYKKLLAEKDEEYALDVVSYMQNGTVVDITAALSLSAARISRAYKLPMGRQYYLCGFTAL